jgi:OOP family OmpA-OmpF porin
MVQDVDNFLVLLDTSGSKLQMTGKIDRQTQEEQAINLLKRSKQIVLLMNETIPYELDLQAGLRAFGQIKTEAGRQNTVLLYGMTEYFQSGLTDAVNRAPAEPAGLTYLAEAIDAASFDMETVSGKTALIIVSDGVTPEGDPVGAAADLADMYGSDVCIYCIHIGVNPKGLALLEQVSQQAECGFTVQDSQVQTAAGMADFVEQVFLAEPPPPEPEPEPEPAPPPDTDGDGYIDSQDMCPNSPQRASVDSSGCWVIERVHFDFDQASIKPEYEDSLADLAMVMRLNPDLSLTVHGHADSIGSEEYNMNLSERRAEAAKQFLARRGIDEERISTEGHGETDPVASNETEDGREQNRRVEFDPSRR